MTFELILASPLLAKAVVKRESGFDILIVHDQSTQNEFYIRYTARTKRSPRRVWKFAEAYPRDLSPTYFQDFESFVAHYAQTKQADIVLTRFLLPRRLAHVTSQTTLTPSINPLISMTAMWSMRDKARGIFKARRLPYFANRDRSQDAALFKNFVPENEVHVYYDECPHCGKYHSCAHFPDQQIGCYGLSDAQKNPTLQYVRFDKGRFVLRYLSPADSRPRISYPLREQQ